jgi:GDPmannose 4,6-dehydratase
MTAPSPVSRAPRRVLVTGVTGQDGSYLAEQLLAEGATVFGLVLPGDRAPAGVVPIEGDLTRPASLARALDAAEPDEVYNLAAATFVPGSWADPSLNRRINAEGALALFDAIRERGAPVRLCHASSAEIFGAPDGAAKNEQAPIAPATPYGEAKAEAHHAVARLRDRDGVFACSAILFNHESPRRPPHFVTRKITQAAARIACGLADSLALGDLHAARDWGYAPEYVAAMRAMLAAGEPRDYVIATGRAATVGDFVQLAFARAGVEWERHVTTDPAFVRAGDTLARIGDASLIARELGWKAVTPLEEIVRLMVDADLELARAEARQS